MSNTTLPPLPQAYLTYMAQHAQYEGFTAEPPGYIAMWSRDEIAEMNKELEIDLYAPGYIAFAGDGGGEVLAFDAEGAVYSLPMVGMDRASARRVAASFQELERSFEA